MNETRAAGLLPEDDDIAAESRAEHDDVSVEKQVRWLDEDTLRVEFGVTSAWNEPIEFRLEEPIPTQVPLDNVGFHGDYGWQNWYVEHDTLIAHEVELEPNEELLTLYAVKLDENDDPTAFGNEPVFEAKPVLDDEEDGPGAVTDDEATPSDASDQTERTPQTVGDGGSTEGSVTADTSMFEDANSSDESVDDESVTAEAEADDGMADQATDDDPAEETAATTEAADGEAPSNSFESERSLVSALLEEVESGAIADEDLDALRSELGGESESDPTTSLNVRLQRVERELNEVTAYTEALEDFLNENGTGRELLEDLKSQSDGIEQKVDGIQDTVDDLAGRLETVEARGERFDAFSDRLDELSSNFEQVSDRTTDNDEVIDSLSERLDTVENRYVTETEALQEDIDGVATDLEDVQDWQQRFVRLLNDFTMFATDDVLEGEAAETDVQESDEESSE